MEQKTLGGSRTGISRRGLLKVGGAGGVLVAASALAAACNSNSTASASNTPAPSVSKLQKIRTSKQLVVATSGQEKPNSYRDTSGNLTGYFVDVAQQMATDLGATPMYVSPSGSGMLAGVKAGQIDIISEAVTNTPTRALSYFFSNPYYPSLTVLLVRKADKKASYDDYNQSSVKVAAELGSTQASYLSFYFPKAQADLLTGVSTVALEVSSGRAAGAVMDSADASSYIHSNPDVTYFSLDNPLGFEYGALVSQYGDWEFKNWIDEWTRYWNARGFFQTTYDKYYNSILPAQLLSTLKIPRY